MISHKRSGEASDGRFAVHDAAFATPLLCSAASLRKNKVQRSMSCSEWCLGGLRVCVLARVFTARSGQSCGASGSFNAANYWTSAELRLQVLGRYMQVSTGPGAGGAGALAMLIKPD